VAKLKAPLLSLGAAGALGKSLVFFGWKGIDAVREYVIPSNPRTALQTTQRGYLTDAVAKIHACQILAVNPLDADDIAAYAALGATRPTPRTWFNEAVKVWIDTKVAGFTPIIYCDGYEFDDDRTAVDLRVQIEEETGSKLAAGKFYLGKTRTALIHSYAGTITVGDWIRLDPTDISSWAAVGDKIYWQFKPDAADPCEGANSGIYSFIAT